MLTKYTFLNNLHGFKSEIPVFFKNANFHIFFSLNVFKKIFFSNKPYLSQKYLITNLFVKKKNFNKLYLNNSYLFISSGIILKFNNLFKKNLKNKPTIWNLFFLIFTKIKNFTHQFFLKNLFFNLKKIFKNLLKYGLLNSWIYVNLFTSTFTYNLQKIRRIKKWIKKKYFKVLI